MLVLEEQPANVFFVRNTIGVEEMKNIGGKKEEGSYQLTVETREATQYRLKLALEDSGEELLGRILLFQHYYKAVIESKAHLEPTKLIDTYNQIIVEADSLGSIEAVRWAKSKILLAAALL